MRSKKDNTLDLFEPPTEQSREELAPGAWILRGFALPDEAEIISALNSVIAQSSLRHMVTPGGYRMSVAMTNCGSLGWITDATGYRYDAVDPETNQPWPKMPDAFYNLATAASVEAGFPGFSPDACLVNRYEPGTKLSLHQDKDEKDFAQPIVSVSLGIPATFLFGGERRAEKAQRVILHHGDVVVWGGTARLRYHGVLPLKDATHALLGRARINLTFRKAG
ncbi:MAG TPA: DNA oxidative demethylase AlkB [Terriglobales bacterium]|nr:DNA oxidative demethylase AlkB [Terriglobales bacterium]